MSILYHPYQPFSLKPNFTREKTLFDYTQHATFLNLTLINDSTTFPSISTLIQHPANNLTFAPNHDVHCFFYTFSCTLSDSTLAPLVWLFAQRYICILPGIRSSISFILCVFTNISTKKIYEDTLKENIIKVLLGTPLAARL